MITVAQKQHIDDDRWNHMCRRVRRVEVFNLLVVVLCAFFSDKVTITWNTPNPGFNPKVSTQERKVEVKGFVQEDHQAKPLIRKVSKEENTEPVQVERKQSEWKNSARFPAPLNPFVEEEEPKSNDEIEKYLIAYGNSARHNREKKTEGNTKRSSKANATPFQVNENRDEKNETSKKVSFGKINRDLQFENVTIDCDGTLFELVIELDFYGEETAWELAKNTPDNVIYSVNYTMEDSSTTQAFTACLDDGNYIFTLYDSFWDGIDCRVPGVFDPCFNITLNNVLAVTDIVFDTDKTIHAFDTSKKCIIGSFFEVEDTSGRDFSDVSWILIQEIHGKDDIRVDLAHEATIDSNGETRSIFSACVNTGTFALEGQEEICDHCYRVLIDGKVIRKGKDFLGLARHKFYVSPLGKVYEQNCDKLPQLTPTNFVNNFAFDETIERKLDAIYSLASMDTITNNPFSSQYKAACWMIFDDTVLFDLQQSVSNITALINDQFMERYVLALFLFATGQDIEKLQVETCNFNKERVVCNKEKSIIIMDFMLTGITGYIPSELHHLLNLEILDLGKNNLHGKIPNQLGRLSHLEELYLDDNELTSTIPPELGNLVSLERLVLRQNQLTGTIPASIGRCPNLHQLLLNGNLLDGPVTPGIFKSKKLKQLALGSNLFTGTMPSEIVHLKDLEEFIIQDNSLTGTIQSGLWSLSSLILIDIDKNSFSGTIDSGIGNLIHLEWFDADQNKLTGELPNVFSNLSKLEVLDIAGNDLQGQIPDTLWETNPKELYMSLNELVGTVPDEFCDTGVNRITVDDSNWFEDKPKVNCACCDEGKCFMWDLGRDIEHIQCPATNIITYSYQSSYVIRDIVADQKIIQIIGTARDLAEMCLSPTGCYSFNVTLSNDGDSKTFAQFVAAYSSEREKIIVKNTTGTNEIETCEVVDLCGEFIGHDHEKRVGLNHITQLAAPNLSELRNVNSTTYKSLCGIMTEDKMYDRYKVCDGTLLQRYVLLYFYHSHKLQFNSTSLFRNETCKWPGVSCDSKDKFITSLSLPGKNLTGTLITEIGLLKTLEVIDLSNNKFEGTISPLVYLNLQRLKKVRLGTNKFAGDFPTDMVQFKNLREFNISGNLFVGSVPGNIKYSKALEIFSIGDNLFQGKFPLSLLQSTNLTKIDVSRNNFEDIIPTEIGNLKILSSLLLNENGFEGSIPFEIFDARNITELMLQSNKITGSIPTHIAKLKNVTGIYMSHNKIKGFIPTELGDLRFLKSLHLQFNQLHGVAPKLRTLKRFLDPFDYITDCGDPDWGLPFSLKCEGCTMCCNSMNFCQMADPTILPTADLLLTVILIPICCLLLYMFFLKKQRNALFRLFVDDRDPLSIFNDDSVYCFILSNNLTGTLIYFITVVVQISIFATYLISSEFKPNSDWEYSYKCLGNSIECRKDKTDDYIGQLLFFVVTILFLGNDFSMSLLQLRKSVYLLDKQLLLSGFILFFLTAFALLVSYRYNTALAEKNTDWITNAMILLFVNELDEKILNILIALAPDWTDKVLEQVTQNMETKRPHHIPTHAKAVGAARRNITRLPINGNGKDPSKPMPIPAKFPNASQIHYPVPPAIVGLLRKPSSRFHLNEKDDPDSKDWHTNEIDNPNKKNWHSDEVSIPDSNESDTNENSNKDHYQAHSDGKADLDANRHKTTRIDFLDLNQDQTMVDDSVTKKHEEGEDDVERSNQDLSSEIGFLETNKLENTDSNNATSNTDEIIAVDYLDSNQDEVYEVADLDTHEGQVLNVINLETNQRDTVVQEIVQDPQNESEYLDTNQADTNEVVAHDVVQDPQNDISHLGRNHGEPDAVSNQDQSSHSE